MVDDIFVRCPSCGKLVKISELIEGLCIACWKKKSEKNEKIKKSKINIKLCPVCYRVKYKNKWMDIKNLLEKLFEKEKIEEFSYEFLDNFIYVRYGEQHYRFSLKKEVCPICFKYKTKYYDVILQLRGNREKIKQFLEDFTKIIEQKKEILLTDIKEKEEGVDLYLTNFLGLRRLIYSLKRIYKFDIKLSRKLHTWDKQSSRKVYKSTILLKFSE